MHKVLITKELTKRQEAIAHDYGLEVTQEPFIKIQYEYDTVSIPKAEAWIATSANAAKYIDSHFEQFSSQPEIIFCVGEATARVLKNLQIPIEVPNYGTAENVTELVLKKGVKSAVFFKGNLSRSVIHDELADKIELFEVEVYKTELLNKQVDMHEFEGIAFFSPSGVKAFAQKNTITTQKVIAIGTTTKQAVREILNVEPGIPATTSVEDVLFALKEDLA